ncbi:MAG: isoamylase early set domain-containing protein [Thermodesulfobacteriota bacterium]
MALKKEYLKAKPACRVTFTLPAERTNGASSVCVVGDWNDWDLSANPMKKNRDGSFSARVTLPTGNEFQFRYVLDGQSWVNDWEADRYVPTPFGDCENCVVVV